MILEAIMISKLSQSQKTNIIWFYLYEVPREVKFIETTGSMVGFRGLGEGGGRI